MFFFHLNSYNSEQCIQSTTPCMFLYISPHCILLFPYVSLNGASYRWGPLEVGLMLVQIYFLDMIRKRNSNHRGMIILPFPSASQHTSVISQCYCGLSCVYTRVWCSMNGYISSHCCVKSVKQLHSGETTTFVAVSQQHTWPRAVSRDHTGYVRVCVCVCTPSFIISAVSWLHISVTLNISWQLTCTIHTH